MIYVITTFEKVDRNAGHWIKYGSQRTVGYYFNYEDALEVLTNNICDLWEYCYNYAALEALPEGLYPQCKDGYDIEYFHYNIDKNKYEPIDKFEVEQSGVMPIWSIG